jgi:hypothetical protein
MGTSSGDRADDPFGTVAIRRRVLDAWAADAARFREDANAEEDLVRGGYRDRLLVELAQNAADAAVRAGVPGLLRLELTGRTLTAANTGAPLDATGVQGLATLRASAKRDEAATVGRFGVGFSAVLAVSDEPAVLSVTGGVRFSADRARTEVTAVPARRRSSPTRCGTSPPSCCSPCPVWRRSRSWSRGSRAACASSGRRVAPGSPKAGRRRRGRWPSGPANWPPSSSRTGRSRSGPAESGR